MHRRGRLCHNGQTQGNLPFRARNHPVKHCNAERDSQRSFDVVLCEAFDDRRRVCTRMHSRTELYTHAEGGVLEVV
jgi:hypothetical protein